MYDRILVPTDGSDAADAALALAVDVADAHDATLHVLYVADTNQPSLARIEGQVVDVLESEGEKVVESAREQVRNAGVDVQTEVVQGGPARTILDYVDSREMDLVVMGRRGMHGVQRLLLGSVTERVVRNAEVPVLVVPPGGEGTYPPSSVLVGTDGSDGSDAALAEATEVAAVDGATLHVVTVVEESLLGGGAATEERERRNEELLAKARDRAESAGLDDVRTTVEEGGVVDSLTDYAADHGVDLVVVGTHGRTGIDRRLLGSVTEDLLRTADVPVLSVRAVED